MRQPPKPRTGSDGKDVPEPGRSSSKHPQPDKHHSNVQRPAPSQPQRKANTSKGPQPQPSTTSTQTSSSGQATWQNPGRQEQKQSKEPRSKELSSTRKKLLARPLGGTDAARVLGSQNLADATQNLGERQRERRRARRRLTATRAGILVGLVVAVATVVWVVGFSSLFALSEGGIHITVQAGVEAGQSGQTGSQSGLVSGAQLESQSGAQSAAVSDQDAAVKAMTTDQVSQLESQINQILQPWVGTPLVRISPNDIHAELIKVPRIQEADVRRTPPDSVQVTVLVRLAALNVLSGAQYQVLGADGVLLETRDSPVEGLPLATIPESGSTRVQAAQQVASIWEALSPEFRQRVSAVSGNGVTTTLTIDKKRTIIWGDAEDSDAKVRLVELLLDQTTATTIDVSVPSRPVTSNS